jgi:hypothetical protein
MKNHVGYGLFIGRRFPGFGGAGAAGFLEVRPGAVAVVMSGLLK